MLHIWLSRQRKRPTGYNGAIVCTIIVPLWSLCSPCEIVRIEKVSHTWKPYLVFYRLLILFFETIESPAHQSAHKKTKLVGVQSWVNGVAKLKRLPHTSRWSKFHQISPALKYCSYNVFLAPELFSAFSIPKQSWGRCFCCFCSSHHRAGDRITSN